jgi:glycerophosphoryl diester phosphodiesterase
MFAMPKLCLGQIERLHEKVLPTVKVFAHRGSGPSGPDLENTTAAFAAARRLGADGIELDVRRTLDGQLVVHHIPSLTEALEACDGLSVNLEVKNFEGDPDFDESQFVARESARILLGWGACERGSGEVVVSSFSRRAIRAVRDVEPRLERAFLVAEGPYERIVSVAAAEAVEGIHPHDVLVDERLVEAAHSVHLSVRVWTVDLPERIAQLAAMGADAIVTNDVPAARAALLPARLAE